MDTAVLIFTTPLFSFASPLLCALKARYDLCYLDVLLHEVGRVQVVLEPYEVFLDAARRDEAVEYGHAARFVVRTARARTAEGLLADYGAGALFVVVDVSGRVTESVRRNEECVTVRRESECVKLVE